MTIHHLSDRIRLVEYQDMQDLFQVSLIIGVIEEDDAIYLIDSGLGPDQLAPIIAETNKPVHLILTHSHWDHIWGAQAITGEIYGHRLFEQEMSQHMLKKFKRYRRGVTRLVTPTVLVDDHLRVGNLELFATPGHTKCSLSIWDPIDKALFVGDSLFIKYRDHDLTEQHIESLKKYLNYPFQYLIPGHIGLMGRDRLERIIRKLEREKEMA